jgi:N-acyl amino acid synthase of PEP-CTERM/exosortase system
MLDIFRFRFEVYCKEKNFLSASDFVDGLEFDEFDSSAAHFSVHDRDAEPMGYVRLVVGGRDGRFPLHHKGVQLFDDFVPPPIEESAEISRLIVRSQYRRSSRSFDHHFSESRPGLVPNEPSKNTSALVQLKLIRLMYHYCLDADIRWLFSVIERGLARKFMMMQFPLSQIGPKADYYGPVEPYLLDLRLMEQQLSKTNKTLFDWLQMPGEDDDARIVTPVEAGLPHLYPGYVARNKRFEGEAYERRI